MNYTSAIGRYEDSLEKRDGTWYIARRRRIEYANSLSRFLAGTRRTS